MRSNKAQQTQITVLGLGKFGASTGLALGQQPEIQRVGYDEDDRNARAVKKMGAVDQVFYNIPDAVRDADVVIICTPAHRISETLEFSSKDLREGALVLDMSPAKETAFHWAETFMTRGQTCIGLMPVINTQYLLDPNTGIEAAHADLFRDCWMGIVTPHQTSSEAIKMAESVVRLLGAFPLHSGALEIDGLVAMVHTLPLLMAAAYINTAHDQPGWQDAQKFASEAYALTGELIRKLGAPDELTAAVVGNRENTSRMITSLITVLQALQDDINDGRERDLHLKLKNASDTLEAWRQQRSSGADGPESLSSSKLQTPGGAFRNLFGFQREPKKIPMKRGNQ